MYWSSLCSMDLNWGGFWLSRSWTFMLSRIWKSLVGTTSKTTEFHEKLWNGIEINEKLQIKTGLFEFSFNFLSGTILETKVQKISNFLVLISSKKTERNSFLILPYLANRAKLFCLFFGQINLLLNFLTYSY